MVGLDRCNSEETGEAVKRLGHRYQQVICDLQAASVEELNTIVSRVVSEMGRVDILVNNAGIIRRLQQPNLLKQIGMMCSRST